MLLYAFLEFADSNGREGHVSYLAKQYNLFLHHGLQCSEWEGRGIRPDRFRYSWWRPEHATNLQVGFEVNPEAVEAEVARLKDMFGAHRAQIFIPELGIPEGAEIHHPLKQLAEVIPIEEWRRQKTA
jgi:hypothetical protein